MTSTEKGILVSIIIPVYNASAHLRKALDSVCQQTYPSFELILVDDGSTDDSSAICESYRNSDPRIKVLKQVNAGAGPARNFGLEHAAGDLIYFMDSDDWIEPTLLETAAKAYQDKPYDMFVFGYNKVSEDGALINKILPPAVSIDDLPNQQDRLAEMFTTGVGLAVWDKVFRADCIRQNNIRFGKKKRTQDFVFVMDALDQTETIRACSESFYNYRLIFNINRKFDENIVDNHIENYQRILNFFKQGYSNSRIATYLLTLRTLWFGIVVPINIVAVKQMTEADKIAQLNLMLARLKNCNDKQVLQNGRLSGKFAYLNRLLNIYNKHLLYYIARIMQVSRRKFKISN